MRSRGTAVAALAMRLGDADAMLCGTVGTFHDHLRYVRGLVGTREGVRDLSTISAHILPSGTFFICDTHITPEPSAEEIVEMTMLACTEVRAFGMEPKVALLSRSNFGTHDSPTAERMRRATRMLHEAAPDLEIDGEMHADAALSESIRAAAAAGQPAEGSGQPARDAERRGREHRPQSPAGPGRRRVHRTDPRRAARSAHVVTQTITVRGLVNMTALAVAQVGALGGARA